MNASRYAAFCKSRLLLLLLALATLLPAVVSAKLPSHSLNEFEGSAVRPRENAGNPAGRGVLLGQIIQGDRTSVDLLRPRDVPRVNRPRTNALARAPILPGAPPVVPQLSFRALWIMPRVDYVGDFGVRRFQRVVDLADFKIEGPLGASATAMPDDLVDLAIDPRGPTYYAALLQNIVAIDPATGKQEVIGLPPGEEKGPRSVAFDTKRQRLLVSSYSMSQLFAYTPSTKKWDELNQFGALAMAYDEQQDALYMFGRFSPMDGGRRTIERCTPKGNFVAQITLAETPHGRREEDFQLKLVGNHFVILAMVDEANVGGETPHIFVYDRKSGDLVYEGDLEIQSEKAEITDEELRKLYGQLALPNGRESSVAVWKILGGGNSVLERLEQLTEKAQPIQEYRTTLILERIGTPEAKALLDKWAADKSRPDRGESASAALERINYRHGTPPALIQRLRSN